MRIRKFSKEDAKEVSKLIADALLNFNSKEYSKSTLKALIKYQSPKELIKKSKTRNYFVAVENNKLLGIGGYDSEGAVHTFFVNSNHHRKGIGKQIMLRVLKEAKKEGIKLLTCHSTRYAKPFYSSFGFKKIKEKTIPFYNSKLRFTLMKKRL